MSALTDLFTNIANAIRDKSGEAVEIPAAQFPTKISGLPAGAVTGTVTASTTKSIVIPEAKGKKHICVVLSTVQSAVSYTVLAQIADDSTTYGVYVYAGDKASVVGTPFRPGLWVPSTGTLTAVDSEDEAYTGQYNWIAW